jgi:hypothetical protein
MLEAASFGFRRTTLRTESCLVSSWSLSAFGLDDGSLVVDKYRIDEEEEQVIPLRLDDPATTESTATLVRLLNIFQEEHYQLRLIFFFLV